MSKIALKPCVVKNMACQQDIGLLVTIIKVFLKVCKRVENQKPWALDSNVKLWILISSLYRNSKFKTLGKPKI